MPKPQTYLQELTLRLALGLESMAESWRERQAAYLVAAQREDGGFAGREGASDLYYTSFALRGLALLGHLQGELAERAGRFLQTRLAGQAPIVDFLSLMYGAALLQMAAGVDVFAGHPAEWRAAVGAALEQLRRPDGGYAKTAEGETSSVYHTFLVVLCQQLLELPTPQSDRVVSFTLSRLRDDGGFVEMSPMKRSGTNPTAAAVGLLRVFQALDADVRGGVVDFLVEMQTDEGGLRANTRIPIADLLSTFTGVSTLVDLGALKEIDATAALRYAESLQLPSGGFHGAAWDPSHDVEYTFYGLGALALLN